MKTRAFRVTVRGRLFLVRTKLLFNIFGWGFGFARANEIGEQDDRNERGISGAGSAEVGEGYDAVGRRPDQRPRSGASEEAS